MPAHTAECHNVNLLQNSVVSNHTNSDLGSVYAIESADKVLFQNVTFDQNSGKNYSLVAPQIPSPRSKYKVISYV